MMIPVPILELLSERVYFSGVQRLHQHVPTVIGLPTHFSVYLPSQTLASTNCPTLFYLTGLTCTEETFVIKTDAQRVAAREGFILIGPDTSPRDVSAPDETDSWDLDVAAGFYLDTTQAPWRERYRMESYIADRLHYIVRIVFPMAAGRASIFEHLVDGHDALTLALRHRKRSASVSAFVPVAHLSVCPWGIEAFTGYLGDDRTAWTARDVIQLMQQASCPFPCGVLVDQDEADKFLAEQLYPDDFAAAYTATGQPLQLHHHPGYDHGHYFIEIFIEDHLLHHAAQLC